MKLASIAVIMFGKRFWSSFRSKPSHLRLENPFYDVESTFKQFNFNLRMLILISSHFLTLFPQKSPILSIQNISTAVDCVFNS